ncbi:BCCT family transporter [Bacillus thermotolerans]|uniref:High-affinity choline uptake protein BetT n=1 Tax=Bacillus thermotolerans TaxID=1221996 RepID=A0A0F5HQN9_BACTR|nr:BCCT family transporter [Bacillus thermotolerans]KKB35679.1 High-affinity choline uptake protein BetT [Bacillus thermotolerans]
MTEVASVRAEVINIIAVVSTTVGIATTFGLSALQMSGGMSEVFNTPNNSTVQLIIIAAVGVVFMIAVIAGVDKGISKLSNANLILAAVLLVTVLLLGPTVLLLENLFTTLGSYINEFPSLSLDVAPYSESEWQEKWTVFYWAWLIAWAPFAGTFIARVSRGRTIQEFVLGALLVPALLGAVWFVVFGGTALHFQMNGTADIAGPAQENPEVALFLTLQQLPLGMVLSAMALVLIAIFFVTSAASATYVLAVLSSKGTLKPKTSTEVIWGILIAGIAAALLLSGGLNALQAASIIVALPFTLILLAMCVSLAIALKREKPKKNSSA